MKLPEKHVVTRLQEFTWDVKRQMMGKKSLEATRAMLEMLEIPVEPEQTAGTPFRLWSNS